MLQRKTPPSPVAAAAGVLAGLLAAGVAAADDRNLLPPPDTAKPYFFVVFDTSGSMANSPPCTRERALGDFDPFDAMCTSECPLARAECARICPDLGCGEYDFSGGPPPDITTTPSITRDNGGPGTSDNGWTGVAFSATAEGGSYLFHALNPDFSSPGAPGCGELSFGLQFANCAEASFDPGILAGGDYMVFVKWPVDVDDSFASNTLIEIVHDDPDNPGLATTSRLAVDQRFEGGRWNAIGTYRITPGVATGVVTIKNDNANGIAVADAVGWLPVTIPACVGPDVYRCQQPICNEGDCYTDLSGDDPRSKLFQAKQALYGVVDDISTINYGFATFEQDRLRMAGKHWLYRVADQAGLPTLGGTDFLTGAEEVFGNGAVPSGDGWNCLSLGPLLDGQTGCSQGIPGDIEVPWDLKRVRRIPRLGLGGGGTTGVYYRKNRSRTYRVQYSLNAASDPLGSDTISVNVVVTECPDSDCEGEVVSRTVVYERVTDFAGAELSTKREPMSNGAFFQGQRDPTGAIGPTCNGLDGNTDTAADEFVPASTPSYNLRWPTQTPPDPRGPRFDVGDFVPLDWRAGHQSELLGRLAPNVAGGDFDPDFRSARFFEDDVDPSDSTVALQRLMRLRDPVERPILAFGSTPLGASLLELEAWWENGGASDGWADIAAIDDGKWSCRRKALLVLTDGLEQCGGDACPVAARLYQPSYLGLPADEEANRKLETFVVGFGLPGASGTDLACMAYNGRTAAEFQAALAAPPEDPDVVAWQDRVAEPGKYLFLPENQSQLTKSIRDIISQLVQESQTFASAALPAIQSTAADNIYLSRFFPLLNPSKSVWAGRLDAFRQPLPLNINGEPDLDRFCNDPAGVDPDRQSACFSWEASAQLCAQAPSAADLAGGDYKLGATLSSQRRVLYGQGSSGSRPNGLRLFSVPDTPSDPVPPAANPALSFDAEDLAAALDPSELRSYEANGLTPTELRAFFEEVIGGTLKIKEYALDPADLPVDIGGCDTTGNGLNDSYVLGDIFHANPVPILNPNDFTYFAADTDGYRAFARENLWRRRMLATGSNDGQLHFFDIGVRQLVDNNLTPDPSDKVELFNDGSGHELFSYIPRAVLPVVRAQASGNLHVFSVDGTVAVADVFIDPADAGGGAVAAEREWRTVLIGGLREGGTDLEGEKVRHFKSGYYALDLTRPDILNDRTPPTTDPSKVPCPASNAACDETTTGLPSAWSPSCLGLNFTTGAQVAPPPACGPLPFPLELWTFDDSEEVSELQVPPADNGVPPNDEVLTFYLDEDRNGFPDLADTWSRPVIGRIRVCPSAAAVGTCDLAGDSTGLGQPVEVAIFGGGMDPKRKGAAEVGGSYLYMVKVETGEVIYKRELPCPPDDLGCSVGSAAGDPAVIDENGDGLFDFVYIGTTGGYLYKVDLTQPSSASVAPARDVPQVTAFSVNTEQLVILDALGRPTRFVDQYPGAPVIVTQPERVTDSAWDPFPILDTEGIPIYHAPAAFFIPELGDYGLAIGTGDRENLESETPPCPVANPVCAPRFFVIVDEDLINDPLTAICAGRPLISRQCLSEIKFTDDPDLGADHLVRDPTVVDPNLRRGWVLLLRPKARVTNEAFLVAGITIFTAFEPGDCEPPTSRVFVVSAKNAGPVAPIGNETDPAVVPTSAPPGERNIDRYEVLDEFITAPFIGNTATKNPNVEGDTILGEIDDAVTESVRRALLGQYPRGTRFNKAFSLVIAALKKSAGVEVFATVPVGVYPADWKDQ